MTPSELKQFIITLPKNPGVYTFRDATKKPLYIGKASNLKSRVIAYTKVTDSRLLTMIQQATSLTHQETSSDIEALILESQSIKKFQPQFNIMLRDDKQYFYVAFTDEEFPHIYLTHQSKTNKIKAPFKELVGPFTDGSTLKITLKFLRKLFPYCTCKQKHHVKCLNGHIGKCLGFCCLKNPTEVQPELYKANIKAIHDILNGKRNSLIREFEKEMKMLGEHGEFEKAIQLREKIEHLKRIFENAQLIKDSRYASFGKNPTSKGADGLRQLLQLPNLPTRIEGYDISNIQGDHATGSMVVFEYDRPTKAHYRLFNIQTIDGANDTAMLREVLTRRFNHPEWPFPELILIDGGRGQINAAMNVIKKLNLLIPIISLTKNDRHVGDHILTSLNKEAYKISSLPEAVRNLIINIDNEAHRFAINQYRRLHRKHTFN